MKSISMTALVSAFARAYHSQENAVKVFDDSVARRLLTDEEYGQITQSMANGIGFFNPQFEGTPQQALRWIVDNRLSPTPLGRAAFAERALELAEKLGARQYLILAAGYDTFAYRQPDWAREMEIFELDLPESSADKRKRLKNAGIEVPGNVFFVEANFAEPHWENGLLTQAAFHCEKNSFCSLLGAVYYLSKQDFRSLLSAVSRVVPKGSTLVFDYPCRDSEQAGESMEKLEQLAKGANEEMLASYTYAETEKLLSECGFLIYEHLSPHQITEQYFERYNSSNTLCKMEAAENVSYCLAVRE